MIEFSKNLYIGKKIDNKNEIIDLISKNTPILNIFFICIDKKSNNLMEIIESKEIFKKINLNKNYMIIGIARGKSEAIEIVIDIFNKWIKQGKYNFNKNKSKFF